MSSSRSALRLLPRALSVATRRQCLLQTRTAPFYTPLTTTRIGTAFSTQTRHTQSVRWQSSNPPAPKVYQFEDIRALISSPSPSRILIDVREPSEFEAGAIPTALNIPIKSQPDAIFLSEEEFEDRFGFQKPEKDSEVVFYCKAGVRSMAAARLALQGGYERVGEYRGSWVEWVERGGEGAK